MTFHISAMNYSFDWWRETKYLFDDGLLHKKQNVCGDWSDQDCWAVLITDT